MNIRKITYLSLVIASFSVAMTQPNTRLVFAELGYGYGGYGGYGNDPSGYSFDPTGYYSPLFTYFDGPETSGKNIGLDTRVVPFESLNWNAAITLVDSPDAFQQELTQNGHTYRSTVTYGFDSTGRYNFVTSLAFSVDGNYVLTATNLQVPRESFLLYEGTDLMIHLLAGGEIINGGSAADTLIGFDGDDSLRGGAGDDTFDGGWGINYISGGDGIDTAIYYYDDSDYVLSKNPVHKFVEILVKQGGSLGVVLEDVEKLQFRNTTLSTDQLLYWGTYSYIPLDSTSPVHRFYNPVTNGFFYTSNADEATFLLDQSSVTRENIDELQFAYQGGTFEAAHSYNNTVGLYRFFNTASSNHFYTASSDEANYIDEQILTSNWPFVNEGVTFDVYASDPNPGVSGDEVAVYRFYNPDLDRHFFTADDGEIILMEATESWINEGVAFYGEQLGR